jgi:tetratricopeptide (TPR) repeat protein
MTHPTPHNDWKLLLTIGALVVTGAVAIVVLSGLGGEEKVVAEPLVAPAPRAEAVPASYTGPETNPFSKTEIGTVPDGDEKTPGSMVGPEVDALLGESEAASAEPVCSEDPDVDAAHEGFRAWVSKDYPRAAACFGAAVGENAEDAYGHYMLGLSLWKAGRTDEAAEALVRSAELNPISIKTYVNLSRVLNDASRFEAALEAAENARAIDPQDATALYLQARSLRNLGRVDDAVIALEQALAFDADYGQAHNLLGLIRIHQGRNDEAVEQLERAAALEPETAFVQANLGRALELAGRPDRAAEAYRAALDLDPDQETARIGLERVEAIPTEPAGVEVAETEEPLTEASPVAMAREDGAAE